MSIDIKCNKCGSAYSVTEKLAGGSVRCSKCKAPIHVPIVRQQPAPLRAATAAEAAADAELSFDYGPSSADAAVAVAAPPSPTTKTIELIAPDAASHPEPPAQAVNLEPASEEPETAPSARPRRIGAGKLAQALSSLRSSDFDFRFRNYWSRSLSRALWVFSLFAAAYLGYLAIGSLTEAARIPGELGRAAEWTVYVRIFFIIGGVILLRIGLETVSVLFNIAILLREVRDELRSQR